MAIEKPERFDIKDLYIDVKLEALVNGEPYDFTGRRHFTAGFFKENIGFGISNIRIEVNTSLQPIVEITMLDLYGNTMFGGQYNDFNVDYSSFFRWPPPKFMFTFKGYLGRPVTWILNLKQYDINFISQSGHYELKASFVPNQWGFFGDMPFLYLLAVKRLRMNRNGGSQTEVMSIFDLIDIGKRVEVKTLDVTKKYDGILKKLSAIQNNLALALAQDGIVSFGENINGEVDGQAVKGFENVSIRDITQEIKLEDILIQARDAQQRDLINQFLFTKMRLSGKLGGYDEKTFSQFKSLPETERKSEEKRCLEIIKKNVKNINEEISANILYSSKYELSQITISEVMRQIAQDSAYIMGRILEAGFKGNSNDERVGANDIPDRHDKRNSQESESRPRIVGQYYPLVEKEGEELPALSEHTDGTDYGIENSGCEMDFVREFINAVVEGIVQYSNGGDEVTTATSDDGLISRVSNLEASSKNPYKPFYNTIAENVLIRSGIAAFMTRSDDPNLPGFHDGYFDIDRYAVTDVKQKTINQLAEEDAKNITDNMIKSMPNDDVMQLKMFVDFFINLFSDDGEDIFNAEGKKAFPASQVTHGVDENTPESILDYKVIMKLPEGKTGADLNTQEKINAANLSSNYYKTFREFILNGPIRNSGMRGLVDENRLTARKLINNGLIYTYPHNGDNDYYILVYEGEDARKVKGLNTTPTDSEFAGTEINKDGSGFKGLIEITQYKDVDGKTLGRVDNFNSYVEKGLALDYAQLKNIPQGFYDVGRYGGLEDDINFDSDDPENGLPPEMNALLWKKKIVDGTPNDNKTQTRAENIVYTILYHKSSEDTRVIFGPFLEGAEARNQRAYIKTICKAIKGKIKQVEKEREQVVNRVLGKAQETESIIYKQMHSMFHQWSSLAYKDVISETGDYNGSSIPENGYGIANELEELYGGIDKHINSNGLTSEDIAGKDDCTFIYDYPLQRIREADGSKLDTIDVKQSIISLDPLNHRNSETTVLNMIYNLCSKNNFLFMPIPGYAGYLDVKNVYKPYEGESETRIRNFFHIMFIPTPESRSMMSNKTYSAPLTFRDSDTQRDIKGEAISFTFGSVDNQVVKNVSVGTRDNKVTAESIINLQRLTDKEDNNKTVTTDCSMLNVMAGRSYMSKLDILGNSQVYPMQFYFLEKMPLFDGLYQIMKVDHTITPNDMTTSIEGIRMRFNPGSGYFSIPPVTLGTLQSLLDQRPRTNPVPDGFVRTAEGRDINTSTQAGEDEIGDGNSVEVVRRTDDGTDDQKVNLLPYIRQAQLSSRLTNMGDSGPIVDNNGPNGLIAEKGGIIQCMNNFIEDILEPFAQFFKTKDPELFKKWTITSGARKYIGDEETESQHLRGQAVDSSIPFLNQSDGLINNHKLLNYIMEFYAQNPSLEYGQILMETRNTLGRPQIWVHWSYRRSDNQKQRLRFVNDKKIQAPMNTGRGGPQVNSQLSMRDARMTNLLS
jgi:hypothetical protein